MIFLLKRVSRTLDVRNARLNYRLLTMVLTLVCCLPVGSLKAARNEDESPQAVEAVRVIEGLKQRRLFELVDIYVAERMAAELLTELDKAAVTLAAIQAKVSQATSANDLARDDAFQQVENLASQFKNAYPEHPLELLVDLQVALAHLAHGNLIRQEIDAEMVSDESRVEAIEQFRRATSLLRDIEKRIDRQLPIARSRSLEAGELTPDQLTNLKNGIRYRIATVNLAKAQLYDADDSLNRADALNQVLSRLEEVTTSSNPSISLWWEAQISRAETYRVTRQTSKLKTLFRQLPAEAPLAALDVRVLTERILTAVEFEQQNAWPELLKRSQAVTVPTPQLQLAVLQLVMARANRATGTVKQQRQVEATQLVNQIESSHGRYWGRRAEILLVGSVQPNAGQPTAAGEYGILVRQGDAAFRRKNFEDAAKAFSKAVSFATDANDASQALAMVVRLSQCYEQLKQHGAAASSLFATSLKFTTANSAAQVHLRGCWNLLQVSGEQQDEAISNLQTHIANWPDQEPANQARLWLATTYQREKNWRLATKTYAEIDLASEQIDKAIKFIGPSARQWIYSQRESGADWKASAREFVALVGTRIGLSSTGESTPTSLPPVIRARLLVPMLEIGLPAGVVTAANASNWIEESLAAITGSGSQDVERQLQAQLVHARAIEAVTSKRENDIAELERTIQNLPADSKMLANSLSQMKQNFSSAQLKSISNAVLLMCDRAAQDPGIKDRGYWDLERAVVGTSQEITLSSLATLKDLADKNRKSLRIQLAYAQALSAMPDRREAALQQWRSLAAQVQSGSDNWLEAKYNVIRLMVAGGEQAEAKKLAQYLAITSADWKKSKWPAKLRPLLQK